MPKLFLLDAYALIYRAYYALIKSPRVNSKGLNTSAIMGFVNTLEEVLTKENPTHIGVAFDPAGPTFRHEAYPEYKAQREETPEAIRLSVPYIKQILEAYNIPILEVAGYEADDVIGTLAKKAGAMGIETYMMTPDKDYGQLVSSNVFMYRPKFGDKEFEVMGPDEVMNKYGLSSPLQVIDMLGLMGDAADNIPGCPGVGEKTAVKLISQYGSIENLLEHKGDLKGALKTKIETNEEGIVFSKFLATIKTDVPIELDMPLLERKKIDEQKLRSLFEELEFRTLINRILNKDKKVSNQPSLQGDLFAVKSTEGKEEPVSSNLKTLNDIEYDYQLVDTEEKMNELCGKIFTSSAVSVDTETTSTDAMKAELVGLSFSIEENKAFYVPIPSERDEALKIVNIFKGVYESPDLMKIGQNIKYDIIVLANYGVKFNGPIFDTMIAHYVLQPELRHNMDYMAEVYLNYKTIHIDELIGPKGKGQKNMRSLSPSEVYKYASEDADVTLKLKNIFEVELKKNGLYSLFEEI